MSTNNIFVTRSSMPLLEEYVNEIRPIWESHLLTNMGPKHEELKRELVEYLNIENIDLLVNGHMALEMTIQAFEFPLGAEIITTPFTFASTTHAIVRNGLKPVFCDINPVDYTIDVNKIEELITDNTCAILPVHVYGNICDVTRIQEIADKYGLKVIYDAAHAFGESVNEVNIANYGDASIFSFHATKVFNTIEGGAVCYKDSCFGRKLYNLKNFGIRDEETIEAVGANAKLNEFAAAMGICNLRHISDEIVKRKKVYEKYIECLISVKGITLPQIQQGVQSNYAYFPIFIDERIAGYSRNELYRKLRENGVYARKYFYPITSEFDCYKGLYDANLEVARECSREVLTLPMYAELSMTDVLRITELIKN